MNEHCLGNLMFLHAGWARISARPEGRPNLLRLPLLSTFSTGFLPAASFAECPKKISHGGLLSQRIVEIPRRKKRTEKERILECSIRKFGKLRQILWRLFNLELLAKALQ
jgi:hypothetical protein